MRRMARHFGVNAVPYGEVRLKALHARPDYAVDIGRSVVGYIELKAPDRSVPLAPGWKPATREREQWEKLKALPNIIYTDGTKWCRYSYGIPAGPVVELDGNLTDPSKILTPHDHGFAALINDFLLSDPQPPHSLADLIGIVARLCDLLHDEVYSILKGSPEHAAHEHLTLLAEDWRDLLFPGLDDKRFADAFAQTITFALLLARVDGISLHDESLHEIARLLSKKHSLMGRAFAVLTDGSAAEELSTIETLRRVIAPVNWQDLEDNLTDTYAELYERFLAAYDPALRKTTGSFYTPPPVARFMVNFVDEVLRVHMGQPWGFADDVVVIDPAMGAGTYLVEIVRSVANTVSARLGPGARADYLQDLIRRRLVGFEIQVATYAVAELRLHQALKSHFGIEVSGKELRFLTDALADVQGGQERLGAPYRVIELLRDEANRIKRSVPVMVVIGNPPHVENAKGRAPWVEEPRKHELLTDTHPDRPSLDEFRSAEGKHGMYESDLHGMPWYFWRWACWKVFEAHPADSCGVVAFITPASLLKSQAFSGIRGYLRRTCDEGWIIDLSPEGNRPPSNTRIFGADVGRQLCIAIFTRFGKPQPARAAEVHYLALHGSRQQKIERLENVGLLDRGWEACGTEWNSNFLPAPTQGWAQFAPLNDVMPWRSRGITPGRTWVYAPTADVLKRRWSDFISANTELRRLMFHESRDRTLDKRVGPLPGFPKINRTLAEDHEGCLEPVQVAYRSFDRQWIIPDNRLIVMGRPPLWSVRSDHQIYVSEQDAHEIGSGPGLVFSPLIPDLHHFCGWGGGGVHPMWRDRSAESANMAPGLLAYLGDQLGTHISPDDFLAYIASLVCHPGFTRRFRPELRQPGVRIPFTHVPELWAEAVMIGRRIIWLHTFGTRYIDFKDGRPAGERSLIEKLGVKCVAAVRTLPRQISDQLEYDEDTNDLLFGGGRFGPVTRQVLDYDVGGRRIIWRWLNDRMLMPRNKRKTSTLDDLNVTSWSRQFTDELLALLSVLKGCVEQAPKQEALLDRVCGGPLISMTDLRAAGVLPVSRAARSHPPPDNPDQPILFSS